MDNRHGTERGGSIETEDHLLGGRVRLHQPAKGYRVAVDPVLLAAAMMLRDDVQVLDAGCGTGAAALCLAARTRVGGITGVELDPMLAALARRNVAANGFEAQVDIAVGSFREFADNHVGRFDQVMINPPFHAADTHTPSPSPSKAAAHGELSLDLRGWIDAAWRALKPGGRLTMIHRADRIGLLSGQLECRFGALTIFPLWPRAGSDANRVLVSAIKGRRTLPRLMAGLVLHQIDGSYTAEAKAILRDAAPMDPGPASE